MSDLRSIISHGKDNTSKWFVISDGISITTGKDKLIGRQVRVSDEQEYLCSCTIPPFRKKEEDCIHIKSLKSVEEEVRTQGKEIIPYKQKEILTLQAKVDKLESIEQKYKQNNQELLVKIGNLQYDLQTAEVVHAEKLKTTITGLQKEKELKDTELRQISEKKEKIYTESKEKEEGLQQYITLIREQLTEEKRKSFNLKSAMDSFKRSSQYSGVPIEITSRLSVLCEIKDSVLVEKLNDEICAQIPDSNNAPKKKIKLGNVEHSYPKQFYNFVEQLSNNKKIHEINCVSLGSCKKTKIKASYAPGTILSNGQKSNCWIVHLIYVRGNFAANLYLKNNAKTDLESMALEFSLKKILKI